MTKEQLKQEVRECLETNIMPFWINKMQDTVNGGFFGRIDGNDNIVNDAEKGAILNARILWSFSAAYRVLGKKEYLHVATRALRYVIDKFIDNTYGGVYWSLDCKGNPLDTKKQSYAIGFAIYGLSEYARATGDKEALDAAVALYHDLEEHAFDKKNNGYVEALTRDWAPIADMRLSEKDENTSKTMNTHLHIIEPYTNLYRVWKNDELKLRIINLINIFLYTILNKQSYHLDLFFDDCWQGKRNIQSFGHDIEASWLLHEAALVIGEPEILGRVETLIKKIAIAADEGTFKNGAMMYEKFLETNAIDEDLHWWVQSESIVGHINLCQYFGDVQALQTAIDCWIFVREHLVDRKNGEWHWSVRGDGSLNLDDDKAGFWKCPYHNSRMCLELIERDF